MQRLTGDKKMNIARHNSQREYNSIYTIFKCNMASCEIGPRDFFKSAVFVQSWNQLCGLRKRLLNLDKQCPLAR